MFDAFKFIVDAQNVFISWFFFYYSLATMLIHDDYSWCQLIICTHASTNLIANEQLMFNECNKSVFAIVIRGLPSSSSSLTFFVVVIKWIETKIMTRNKCFHLALIDCNEMISQLRVLIKLNWKKKTKRKCKGLRRCNVNYSTFHSNKL